MDDFMTQIQCEEFEYFGGCEGEQVTYYGLSKPNRLPHCEVSRRARLPRLRWWGFLLTGEKRHGQKTRRLVAIATQGSGEDQRGIFVVERR